ncbi:hypothetical protein GCHA_3121 [Paraglaciecola chathamensis S18K6]|uniref:Uncharacterized protein n=1 Tax=Paraglaciecola chathamensis S18K6 TaxID=1127672 RepID=A0AAV3V295_9ALTE|nr:hypothetical protein GCHA_3121 [Paraglaciecola chathamensis S18K6]
MRYPLNFIMFVGFSTTTSAFYCLHRLVTVSDEMVSAVLTFKN